MSNIFKALISLAASFLLSGCYTMFAIPPSKYNDIEAKHNKIEITLNNQEIITIEENESILYKESEKRFEITKDSIGVNLSLDIIKTIKEEKFDLIKTFFSSLWISGLSIIVLGLIVFAASGGGLPRN